jgi:hypothetical protein
MKFMEVGLWSRRTDNFKYTFITVDTGASMTTISKEILHQLGYKPVIGDKKQIITASASGDQHPVTVHRGYLYRRGGILPPGTVQKRSYLIIPAPCFVIPG